MYTQEAQELAKLLAATTAHAIDGSITRLSAEAPSIASAPGVAPVLAPQAAISMPAAPARPAELAGRPNAPAATSAAQPAPAAAPAPASAALAHPPASQSAAAPAAALAATPAMQALLSISNAPSLWWGVLLSLGYHPHAIPTAMPLMPGFLHTLLAGTLAQKTETLTQHLAKLPLTAPGHGHQQALIARSLAQSILGTAPAALSQPARSYPAQPPPVAPTTFSGPPSSLGVSALALAAAQPGSSLARLAGGEPHPAPVAASVSSSGQGLAAAAASAGSEGMSLQQSATHSSTAATASRSAIITTGRAPPAAPMSLAGQPDHLSQLPPPVAAAMHKPATPTQLARVSPCQDHFVVHAPV